MKQLSSKVQLSHHKRLLNSFKTLFIVIVGLHKFQISDLDLAAQFCTHLVYGYMGIRPTSLQAHSLQPDLDIDKRNFAEVLALKQKHPNLKVLLGVGGDKDPMDADTYLKLLQSEVSYGAFVNSLEPLINTYGFDGLDLAFQFPRNKPRKVHSELGMIWKKFKKLFTGNFIVDPNADHHKKIFTNFVNVLRQMLGNRLLMLTVLPNVNSTCKCLTNSIRNCLICNYFRF